MIMDIETDLTGLETFSEWFERIRKGTFDLKSYENKPGFKSAKEEYLDYLNEQPAFKEYMNQVLACAESDSKEFGVDDLIEESNWNKKFPIQDLKAEQISDMNYQKIRSLVDYQHAGIEEQVSKSKSIWEFHQRIIGIKHSWETGKLVGYEKGITWANCWEKPMSLEKHMITNAQSWFEIRIVEDYAVQKYLDKFAKTLYEITRK